MVVTLNIEKDDELRAYIKDLISGQVKSIMRDEWKQIIQGIISNQLKMRDFNGGSYLETIIKDQVDVIIKDTIVNDGRYAQHNYIKTTADKYIKEYISNILNQSLSNGGV